jgi:hypothetical protein
MKTIILGLLIFSLIIVISIDAAHKRHNFLDESR